MGETGKSRRTGEKPAKGYDGKEGGTRTDDREFSDGDTGLDDDDDRRVSSPGEKAGDLPLDPPIGPSLTQQDCVVWDESHNLDLRRVMSPAFLHTPKTPSTRASTETTGSSLAGDGRRESPSYPSLGAISTAMRPAKNVDPEEQLLTEEGLDPAASSWPTTKLRQASRGRLGSVAKCLENAVDDDEKHSHRITRGCSSPGEEGPVHPGPDEIEVDRIFNRLERDDEGSSLSRSSSSFPLMVLSSLGDAAMNLRQGTEPDDPLPGAARDNAAVGPTLGAAKSRKRRRRQQTHERGDDRGGQSLRQLNEDGKENATNWTALPRDAETGTATTKEGPVCLQDPFHDLLREMQSKDAAPSTGTQEVPLTSQGVPEHITPRRPLQAIPSTSTQPPDKRSAPTIKDEPSKQEGFASSLPSEALDQSHQPPFNQRARVMVNAIEKRRSTTNDEFGDIDFSMEDLALIDSMVEQATQNDGDDSGNHGDSTIDARDRHAATSASQVARQVAPTADPFGDFPDVDFEALDKTIADQEQQQLTPRCPLADTHSPVEFTPDPGALCFTRYCVAHVKDDACNFVKTVSVRLWTHDATGQAPLRGEASLHAMLQLLTPTAKASTATPEPINGEINLCGDWYFTPLAERDVIHVCSLSGCYNTDVRVASPLILDSNLGDDLLLVVHPDMLLTPTTVSETVTCSRRAVLKNRLGSTGLSSRAPLFGTMRHALFEAMMRERDFSLSHARSHCKVIVRQNAESLVACGISTGDAELEILKVVPQIEQFANEFTTFGRASSAKAAVTPNLEPIAGFAQPFVHFVAHGVEAIEEQLVSPELGLKGNIDIVLQAKTTNVTTSESQVSLMSVELKTGHHQRTQNAHMAQLSLYTLLLSARYGSDKAQLSAANNEGVLLYMNNEAVKTAHVAPRMFEIKALIGNRNLVAIETRRSSRPRGVALKYHVEQDDSNSTPRFELKDPTPLRLPSVLSNSHQCERCFMNRECMLYAGVSDAFDVGSLAGSIQHTHKDLLGRFTGNLGQEDLAYFMKWDRLVDLEAQANANQISDAWLVDSLEREKTTLRSMSSLDLIPMNNGEAHQVSDGTTVLISFQRSHLSSQQMSLENLNFERGCSVIVSTDDTTASPSRSSNRPHMHIVRGTFEQASVNLVTIRASRDDLSRLERTVRRWKAPGQPSFRIDRDEIATGIGTLRQNLVNLFSRDDILPGDESSLSNRLSWLRDVIVRLRAPAFDIGLKLTMFDPPTATVQCSFPGCDLMDLYMEYAELNGDQQAAVDSALTARDYSMIQGLPGTGKTSTIAFVTRLLVAHGKRVLITSYTNSAVDNVLLKLTQSGLAATGPSNLSPSVIRVGRESTTHPGIQPILASSAAFALEKAYEAEADVPQCLPSADCLARCIQAARVVGVTALTLPKSPLLAREYFDVVIVDEAGQITQPAVIGAMMAANTFVLVGDHMQLPPLVASELAEMGGYADSMLKHLAEAHPGAVARLSHQYRMNHEICNLSNDIVYGGALKCADEEVARRQLDLPGFPENMTEPDRFSWVCSAVDPQHPVVFLDTDSRKSQVTTENVFVSLERTTGRNGSGSVVNDTEASIVRKVVTCLMSCGLAASSIGIICPFRAQLRLFDDHFDVKAWKAQGLEVSTIDRYQGRDKDAIVLSFVRSNLKGKVGRLLEDFRRLNVAVTRAKCKLVLVGSYSTLLAGSTHLRGSLERLKQEGRVISVGDAS